MKKLISFSIAVLFVISANAQITIDHNDMPNTGDTIRLSTTTNLGNIAYTPTGTNFLWDFSSLSMFNQRVDTFLSVLSTPLVYIATFNNPFDQEHLATVAGTQPNYPSLPNISITEVYNFYKEATASYAQVGIGAKFNNVPLPVKFDNPDVQLTFPLTYGEKDSCDFEFHLNIPALGYYGESKHRVNYVDGWGTIITPLDTFEVMRIRSEIDVHDTIFADTLGFGFANDHKETEYKWYADTMGIPVMKITKRTGFGGATTAEYIDKYPVPAGVSENNLLGEQLLVAPNPAIDCISLRFNAENKSEASVKIIDICGKLVYSNCFHVANGINNQHIDISGFDKGIYFVTLQNGQFSKVSKFIKE